jgi:Domain of unknown function (DUF1906)
VSVSRREWLKFAAATPALIALAGAAESLRAPSASADGLGVLLDYAAGVIPASQIRAAGALGSIRYVSDRRPGGSWMLGKPMEITEARDLHQNGLKIVSCYQYGKEASADWLGGQGAGVTHAKRGWQLHMAAGGPANVPVYASIDDDPSYEQYKQQVAPLPAWLGVGRWPPADRRLWQLETIEWALQNGLGSYFWQHNWGSPGGRTHPAAHLHQVEIDKRDVGGVGVDINNIFRPQFGQWA